MADICNLTEELSRFSDSEKHYLTNELNSGIHAKFGFPNPNYKSFNEHSKLIVELRSTFFKLINDNPIIDFDQAKLQLDIFLDELFPTTVSMGSIGITHDLSKSTPETIHSIRIEFQKLSKMQEKDPNKFQELFMFPQNFIKLVDKLGFGRKMIRDLQSFVGKVQSEKHEYKVSHDEYVLKPINDFIEKNLSYYSSVDTINNIILSGLGMFRDKKANWFEIIGVDGDNWLIRYQIFKNGRYELSDTIEKVRRKDIALDIHEIAKDSSFSRAINRSLYSFVRKLADGRVRKVIAKHINQNDNEFLDSDDYDYIKYVIDISNKLAKEHPDANNPHIHRISKINQDGDNIIYDYILFKNKTEVNESEEIYSAYIIKSKNEATGNIIEYLDSGTKSLDLNEILPNGFYEAENNKIFNIPVKEWRSKKTGDVIFSSDNLRRAYTGFALMKNQPDSKVENVVFPALKSLRDIYENMWNNYVEPNAELIKKHVESVSKKLVEKYPYSTIKDTIQEIMSSGGMESYITTRKDGSIYLGLDYSKPIKINYDVNQYSQRDREDAVNNAIAEIEEKIEKMEDAIESGILSNDEFNKLSDILLKDKSSLANLIQYRDVISGNFVGDDEIVMNILQTPDVLEHRRHFMNPMNRDLTLESFNNYLENVVSGINKSRIKLGLLEMALNDENMRVRKYVFNEAKRILNPLSYNSTILSYEQTSNILESIGMKNITPRKVQFWQRMVNGMYTSKLLTAGVSVMDNMQIANPFILFGTKLLKDSMKYVNDKTFDKAIDAAGTTSIFNRLNEIFVGATGREAELLDIPTLKKAEAAVIALSRNGFIDYLRKNSGIAPFINNTISNIMGNEIDEDLQRVQELYYDMLHANNIDDLNRLKESVKRVKRNAVQKRMNRAIVYRLNYLLPFFETGKSMLSFAKVEEWLCKNATVSAWLYASRVGIFDNESDAISNQEIYMTEEAQQIARSVRYMTMFGMEQPMLPPITGGIGAALTQFKWYFYQETAFENRIWKNFLQSSTKNSMLDKVADLTKRELLSFRDILKANPKDETATQLARLIVTRYMIGTSFSVLTSVPILSTMKNINKVLNTTGALRTSSTGLMGKFNSVRGLESPLASLMLKTALMTYLFTGNRGDDNDKYISRLMRYLLSFVLPLFISVPLFTALNWFEKQ